MLAFSMPGGTEWMLILLFFGYCWLLISTVVCISKNPHLEMTHKLLWILILVVAPLLGIIVYYVFSKNISSKNST